MGFGPRPPAASASTAAAAAISAQASAASSMRSGDVVTICGFASLMDEVSAREATPSLRHFRLGRVDGHCRVFNLASILNIRRGVARGDRIASCTAVRREECHLRVCLYEVPAAELPALLLREARLKPQFVTYTEDDDTEDGDAEDDDAEDDDTEDAHRRAESAREGGGDNQRSRLGGSALLFTRSSDAEYLAERCGGNLAMYHDEVGRFYSGALYRRDILPIPAYTLRCLRAYAALGAAHIDNFLDASFLGDERTSLRVHLRDVLGGVSEAADEQARTLETGRGEHCEYWSDEQREELRRIICYEIESEDCSKYLI